MDPMANRLYLNVELQENICRMAHEVIGGKDFDIYWPCTHRQAHTHTDFTQN